MIIGSAVGIGFGAKKRKIIASDTFNRADNASSLGNAETGQTWTALEGTWGVASNQAYCPGVAVTNHVATIETNTPDCRVRGALAQKTASPRLLVRVIDAGNCILIQPLTSTYGVYRMTANATTQIGSVPITPQAGDTVELVLQGSSISVYVNGIYRLTVSETQGVTATKHGLGVYSNGAAARWDNFIVEEL